MSRNHFRPGLVILCLGVVVAVTSGCGLFKSGGDDAVVPDGGVGDTCDTSSECASAFVCAGGFCQLEGSVRPGGPCSANRDCDSNLFCTPGGVCGPSGTGGVGDPCATGGECDAALVCIVFGFGGTCEMPGENDLGEPCTMTTDCIAGLACANDGTCKATLDAFPPFTGVDCEPEEAPFRIFFEVPRPGNPPADFFRLPFPNDARVSAAGDLDLSDFPRPGPGFFGVDVVDLYADALEADFRGFSSVAAVTFRFSDQLDFGSIGASAENMHYIDITSTSPDYGNDRGRSFSYTTGRGLFICPQVFTVGNDPHRPLLPNNTYAVYMTTDIRSQTAEAPSIDADFAAMMSDTRPTGDPALENAWDKYQVFRDYLDDMSIARDTIAGAAVFTVQDTTGRAEALATAVDSTPLPVLSDLTLCDTGVVSPCDDGAARTCGAADPDFYEIHGRYSVPIYQQGTSPYALPEDGGGIDDRTGAPQVQDTVDVCMVITIPKGVSKPAGGWPLAIYGHGTGGSFKGVVGNGVARALAVANPGVAVFSWDGPVHGERRNNHPRDEDSLMFNIINPPAARDNNLQGAVDALQAFRLTQNTAVSVTGVPDPIDFDAANLFYFGHSQGSNTGMAAVAVSNAPKAAIFSGAGAHLTRGILTKTSPVDAKSGLEFLIGEPLTLSHPLMVLWQTWFDNVDPLNYAPLVLSRPPPGVATKHVFMTWATDDTFSPPATLNTMARTLQIPIAEPVAEPVMGLGTVSRPVSLNKAASDTSRTAALFQYVTDGYDGHFVATRNASAVADWVAFIESAINPGTPSVP